jgi:hypothetical protein
VEHEGPRSCRDAKSSGMVSRRCDGKSKFLFTDVAISMMDARCNSQLETLPGDEASSEMVLSTSTVQQSSLTAFFSPILNDLVLYGHVAAAGCECEVRTVVYQCSAVSARHE